MSVSGEGAVMTTLNDMTAKKRPEPSAEEIAARELVRLAKEQGLSLTWPDGLLKQFTRSVLETALNEEMTEHLGHEKNRAPGARDSANVRNGTRAKTVLTHASGQVELAVPRDREGTFEPVIVKKRQRRLTEVDEIVLSLYARGPKPRSTPTPKKRLPPARSTPLPGMREKIRTSLWWLITPTPALTTTTSPRWSPPNPPKTLRRPDTSRWWVTGMGHS